MNIKSLILGSATAALAATGAQAADAIIIAEPEPVEYVRVCDVYGAGYFYIPGTETCLRISGWVRHQIGNTFQDKTVASWTVGGTTTTVRTNSRERGFHHGTGAQINLDARSETEYGTLRGWVQLEGFANDSRHPADVDIRINRALIQLGGLYMGYADSLFSSSSNIGGSSLGNYGGFTFADTFDYHYEQRHQIGYQFDAGNGFWGSIAIEHDRGLNNYTPDVVGKIAYQQAWGGVWLAAGYDESESGVGVRGGIQGNFGALTARLDGYYQSKADVAYGVGARWGVQGTALYQINPKFGVAAGLGYYDSPVTNAGPLGVNAAATAMSVAGPLAGVPAAGNYFADGHAWTAQLGVNWSPVQNFNIGADVIHRKGKISAVNAAGDSYTRKDDSTAFRLRFQRNF